MIDLALQGGGSHGAFTWGVLDRLLEDDRILIEGICGTSAGAMNAVVVADGLDRKGKEGAREALRNFWTKVSEAGRFSPFQRTPIDRMQGRWTLDYSPGYIFFDLLSRMVSPYELNPLNMNPLRDLIAAWSTSSTSVMPRASSCSWPPQTYARASRRSSAGKR